MSSVHSRGEGTDTTADGRLSKGDVLLYRSGAGAHGADHRVVTNRGNAPTEDDDVSVVRMLDAVERSRRPCERG
jgi:hypothetical protein